MDNNRIICTIGLLLALFVGSLPLQAQRFSVETVVFLPEETRESSGIIFLNDKLVTHNDSGGDPKLYEIDPETGELTDELLIDNTINTDWEDLTFDQQHIYIADIGNNSGDRMDLRIYQVALIDFFQRTSKILSADTIRFTYEDQTNFDSDPNTNFDAEAIISYGDSLYIFTKNWSDLRSNIYSLPKTPGDHVAKLIGSLNPEGLITSATYNSFADEIMLTGYTFAGPFLFRLWDFEEGNFLDGKTDRLSFDVSGSFQIEGIEAIDETDYLITSESNDLGDAMLFKVNTDFVVGISEQPTENLVLYPNPANGLVHVTGIDETIKYIKLIDNLGAEVESVLVKQSPNSEQILLSIPNVPSGLYHLKIATINNQHSRRLLINRSE